jgi:hypothetical protein
LRDPWSIRQTGFYQAHDSSRELYTWVLLQPSIDIQNGMKRLINPSRDFAENLIESHVLFTSTKARANENWALSGTPKSLLLAQHITTRILIFD